MTEWCRGCGSYLSPLFSDSCPTCGVLQGEVLKDEGQRSVASKNSAWVARMRIRADTLAQMLTTVTTDDLQEIAEKTNDLPTHQNAWGVIFLDNTWEAVGFRKSRRPKARHRIIREWRKKDDQ